MMASFLQGVREMLGAETRPRPTPEDMTEAASAIHAHKRKPEIASERIKTIREELSHGRRRFTWSRRRWVSIIVINLLFVLSFHAGLQMVEGTLSASRVLGVHFADLNAALQVMLAYKEVLANLTIGVAMVGGIWWLLGGRTFCAWVCPYHLLSELAETVHLRLARTFIVRDHPLHRGLRTVLWGIFAVLALATGYTVFEAVSPVGILSRAMVYGPGLALIWVAGLLVWEIFITRRGWCRYLCPIGLTYGLVGTVSPLRVTYHLETCLHEGECRAVCLVPHVLDVTKKGYAADVKVALGPDCTRCGACVEVCPTHSLQFDIKGLSNLL